MRMYSFNNMYLSSIQVGLQTAHVTAELFTAYKESDSAGGLSDQRQMLDDWAEHYKVMILLNGGYSSNLVRLEDMIDDIENPYPWASFRESDDALNGALTSVGIVLPPKIYAMAAMIRTSNGEVPDSIVADTGEYWTYTQWEKEFIYELNNYSLAK